MHREKMEQEEAERQAEFVQRTMQMMAKFEDEHPHLEFS